MKCVLLFKGGIAPQEEGDEYILSWQEWTNELTENQIIIGGLPLAPTGVVVSEATVATVSLTDDTITGYAEVEVKSIDAAIELASRCPNMRYGGTVEIREVMSS